MTSQSKRICLDKRWAILLGAGVLILLMVLLTIPSVTSAQTGVCKTVVIRFRPSSGVKPGEYPWGFNLTWDAQKQKYFGTTVGSAGGGQTVTATVGYGTKGVSISAESGKCGYTFSGEAKGNNLYEGDWRGSSGCAYGTFQAELQGCSSDGTSSGPSSDGKPPVAGTFGVGHGCSYNEPSISPGQLRCAATTTNAPANAKIEYTWKLDGTQVGDKTNTFTRADKDIAPGSHTLIVVAKDTTNNKEVSSSYSFTKAGADPYVSVQCALRSGDDRAVACYADPKNVTDSTTLTYEWTWGGAQQSEKGRTLDKTQLADGVYNVTVRARDNKTGKYTTPAFTSITVGKPVGIDIESIAAGITSALTGTPLPNPPDPVAAAAAAAAISVLLGAGALANAFTSGRGAGARTMASGARTQTVPVTDSQQPLPTDVKPTKPTDLPEQSEAETEAGGKKSGKPSTIKEIPVPSVVSELIDGALADTKTSGKDKPPIKPDTATAKPTTVPEQKPQLTPEEIADRRQQADRTRQEGMREYGTATADAERQGRREQISGGLVGFADTAVDFLSNLTGATGKTIKTAYTTTKNILGGMSEAYAEDRSITMGGLKGAANALVDYGASRAGSKLTYQPMKNPLDPWSQDKRLAERGMRQVVWVEKPVNWGNLPVAPGVKVPTLQVTSDRLSDVVKQRAGARELQVIKAFRAEFSLPANQRIVQDRIINASASTAQSKLRNDLIRDPIKMELGLKEGTPYWRSKK